MHPLNSCKSERLAEVSMTKQRQEILSIIQETPEHLTAEQIYIQALERKTPIAIATVYRNLNLMVEAREIGRVSVLNAPDRFDRTILPHNHMICDCCGKLVDVHLPDLQKLLEKKIKEPLLSYDLTIHYICPVCAECEREGGEGE